MARHYATRDFFRQMPNPLLARYFHARGVFDDLDITALPEPQPDALWAVWLTLDDTQRAAMDAAFQDIAALSGEKGYRAILDDAAWHFATDPAAHAAFVEQLASLAHHGARAMTTFLDHPACWRRAARFFHAEALPAWRKRTHLPHVPAAVDEASLEALAAGLSTYFRCTEGRGTHCVVEPVRRGTLDYFFAYPEDYAQQRVEWVDDQFGQSPHLGDDHAEADRRHRAARAARDPPPARRPGAPQTMPRMALRHDRYADRLGETYPPGARPSLVRSLRRNRGPRPSLESTHHPDLTDAA